MAKRSLDDDPGRWGQATRDLRNLVRSFYEMIEAPEDPGDAEDLHVFVLAPVEVAWALGAQLREDAKLVVYQDSDQRAESFFPAFDLARSLRGRGRREDPLLEASVREVNPDGTGGALVLQLGGHRLVDAALSDAKAAGTQDALVVTRRTPKENIASADFADVLLEAYDAIHDYLGDRGRQGLRVYQNPPVSLAFGLGALTSSLVTQPRLMAWTGGTYVAANVWED